MEGVGLGTGILLDLPGNAFAYPDTQPIAHAYANSHLHRPMSDGNPNAIRHGNGNRYANAHTVRHANAVANAYADVRAAVLQGG